MNQNRSVPQKSWHEYLSTIERRYETSCTPMQITFEITPLCNFNCKMCYVHLNKEEQKKRHTVICADQWIELAKVCCKAGVLSITFTGGEVFSYPGFMSMYEKIYDMGFLVNILSNGYLINDEIVERLSKRKPHKMRITLYGSSDESYFKVTGCRDGYNKVSANILKLKAAGINIGVSMTVVNDNQQDLAVIKNWAKTHELAFVHTCRIHLPYRGSENSAKQIRIVNDDYQADLDLSKIEKNDKLIEAYKNNAFFCCNSCEKSAVVTWEGHLQGCLSISNHYVDAFSTDLIDGFRTLWKNLSTISTPKQCLNCPLLQYCLLCPGSLAAESGDPEKVSPYVCAMARWTYSRI